MEDTTKTTDTTSTTSTEANTETKAETKTETSTNTPPEKPEEGDETEMSGGPMGGERPEMTTGITSENEWLVPMSAAGVVAGSVIVSTIAICIMIWRFGCKCKGCGCKD